MSGLFWFRLVPVSSTAATATEPASWTAKALASFAVTFLAIESSVCAVVTFRGLKRKLFDVNLALFALESESSDIIHLPLRAILIVHL